MLITHYSSLDAIAEFLTIVIIFIFVLAITFFTTKWVANYQKGRSFSKNIQVIETYKITTNKYLQLVKAGDKYLVIAVCKDTVTLLTELDREQIKFPDEKDQRVNFKEILEKAKAIASGKKNSD